MALYPNDQSNGAGAIPVWLASGSGGNTSSVAGPAETGVSASGTVGTSSAPLLTAAQFKGWVTILNTHATQILYISFNASATTSDFAIQPGAALTLYFGPKNALNGIGSGAGTTWAAIGY